MSSNHLLLLSAFIIAASAGSIWNTDTASSTSGACSLVTRQEAAAALGAAVPSGSERSTDVPMQGGGPIKMQSCLYGSEVLIGRIDLGSSAVTLFGKYRQSLTSKSDYQNIKGVGDEAFIAKGQLAVRKGQTGLIIDVGQARGGGAKEIQKEKGLAALAIGRL